MGTVGRSDISDSKESVLWTFPPSWNFPKTQGAKEDVTVT